MSQHKILYILVNIMWFVWKI